MIIESIIGGITIITCSSLIFTNALDKRIRREKQNQSDKLDKEFKEYLEQEDFKYDDTIKIYPYQLIQLGPKATECMMCGTTSTLERGINKIPGKCPNRKTCPVGNRPHLHLYCKSCNSTIYMEPRLS